MFLYDISNGHNTAHRNSYVCVHGYSVCVSVGVFSQSPAFHISQS